MNLTYPTVNGTIEIYMDVMRSLCGDTAGKSMIDLGCHKAPNTPRLGFAKKLYVDVLPQILDHPEEQKYFRKADILEYNEEFIDFDVAICSDCIEHLTLVQGLELLEIMRFMADKQILFTPLTDLFGMAEMSNKDPEAHRSLWSPEMLDGWITISFPRYHEVWNGGAFFAMRCIDMHQEFERIKNDLDLKSWTK